MDTQKLYSLFNSCSGVSIDTRNIIKDEIYFSLKGENFDGNDFAMEAIEKGAKFSIVDDIEKKDIHDKIVYVENSLKALQDLSNYHRSLFDTKVIGITGSNGKTTTKNLIYSILSQKYNVVKTKGNLNNHIGVPLSLLDIKHDTDVAIIEMGANHIGEIKRLCEIAMPDIGLITNYGYAHLEGFGGFEGVVKGKTEIYEYLTENYGHFILNNDDNLQVENCKGDLAITFGSRKDSDFIFDYIKDNLFLKLKIDGYEFNSNLYGDYNFSNLASSITIGKFLDLSNKEIQEGLNKFLNDSNRSEILIFDSNKIYLDAYNANPSSMLAAISNFENINTINKVLILGDMFELGKYSDQEHQKIVDFVANKNYEKVFLVGDNFSKCNTDERYFFKFLNSDDLAQSDSFKTLKNMNILVKGSRGVMLETLFR
ncbi:MAG: UDP-N-acetylmuramoyl-tripeptide--D-alanyl-D-alanine ligase [Bacteroidetes bacterium]|nr:UDP-N-acetylmuramoyl-tripeptide--D-alanyl-D-alanine ligase [Bacteroidota bacterium]MDA1226229.1 UDP-N-acetylmuramoyl-tripeptide--D-alanyl-D-alanine ligase [Bacteroidota bacterium]